MDGRGSGSRWRRCTSALLAIAVAGCGPGAGVGAGEGAEDPTRAAGPTSLRIAHIDGGTDLDPGVAWFAEQVAEVSDGALTVEVWTECCDTDADVEERLVEAVRDGEFELGWVGTRVFEQLDVAELTPLGAPLLLDSYAAQQAVLSDDVAAEMLAALDATGVQGLALVPGPLRHPIADRPLRGPDTWEDLALHVFRSGVAAASVEALGATAVDAGFPERNAGLEDGSIQGLENSVGFHARGAVLDAPYLTLNIGLWARTSALIVNPDVADRLGAEQLDWLRTAAERVIERTGDLAELDAEEIAQACRQGGRFVLADTAQLASLREALQPVHAELGQDDAVAGILERVRAIVENVEPEERPALPDACDEDTAAGVASEWDGETIPDGSYTKTISREEALADGVPAEFLDTPGEFPGVDELRITLRLTGTSYQMLANYEGGTDVGDRGAVSYDAQGRFVKTSEELTLYEWTLTDGVLTLSIDEDAGDYPDFPPEDQAILRLFGDGTYEREE
jgi:TRAP-type transport system periplasmic protein